MDNLSPWNFQFSDNIYILKFSCFLPSAQYLSWSHIIKKKKKHQADQF